MVSTLDSGASGQGSSSGREHSATSFPGSLILDILWCSWARHFTLTVPLSTQVHKWVPANCWGYLTNGGGVTCDGLASRPGEVEILPAASCYRNQDKLRLLIMSQAPRLHFFLVILLDKRKHERKFGSWILQYLCKTLPKPPVKFTDELSNSPKLFFVFALIR